MEGRRVDLRACKDLNELDYAWMANYNQRALHFQVLCYSKDTKCSMSQNSTIEQVKYYWKEADGSETSELYDCYNAFHELSVDNFYRYIDSFLDSFEHENIEGEYWKDIVNCLELFEYKFEKNNGSEFWSTEKGPKSSTDLKEAFAKLTTDQTSYVSAFVQAFRTGMEDGHAKQWIDQLVKILLKCIGEDVSHVKGFSPEQKHNTNTIMEILFDGLDNCETEIEFDRASCLSDSSLLSNSSNESLPSLNLESKRHTKRTDFPYEVEKRYKRVVPDYCVALPEFPGVFPVVFELSPAYQESWGLVQNVQQMLSKLFFQDVVFGVVVSPGSFQLSVIIKRDKNLHFGSTPCMTFRGIQNPPELDLKELDILCTFIFRVLKWARRTKCLIQEQVVE